VTTKLSYHNQSAKNPRTLAQPHLFMLTGKLVVVQVCPRHSTLNVILFRPSSYVNRLGSYPSRLVICLDVSTSRLDLLVNNCAQR
jgi:hypothetical protein